MKPDDSIDFTDVGALSRRLYAQKITPQRFRLEIPEVHAANAVYSAMNAEVAYRHGTLEFDDATRSHIMQAARWLTAPAGKCGLLLMGLCGNGKSTLMRSIARLIEYVTEQTDGYSRRSRVRIVTAKQVIRACVGDTSAKADFRSMLSEPMLAIDDLGTEPAEVVSFGMVHTPMIDLISERYDRQLLTMVTTNLTGPDLEKVYGCRILDRLREMMEVIPFGNPSYRAARPQRQ